MKTTQETLSLLGITPEQVVASLQGTTLLIMDEKGTCHITSGNKIPEMIYEQFILLDGGRSNPLRAIEKHSVMDVMGWGKMDGNSVQLYNFEGLPWAFAAQAGTMLDQYLGGL